MTWYIVSQKLFISDGFRPDSVCIRNWIVSTSGQTVRNLSNAAGMYVVRLLVVTPCTTPGVGWSASSAGPCTPPR